MSGATDISEGSGAMSDRAHPLRKCIATVALSGSLRSLMLTEAQAACWQRRRWDRQPSRPLQSWASSSWSLPWTIQRGRGSRRLCTGSGSAKIALSRPDVVRTTQAWEDAAAPLLRVPANCCDDLSARSALDDAELTSLQRHGLLYDRDERGEFRHLHTAAFHERFFFEAVQLC
jgi:hypothetical protein